MKQKKIKSNQIDFENRKNRSDLNNEKKKNWNNHRPH